MRFRHSIFLFLSLSLIVHAQQLSVKLQDIDLTYLPRVTFGLCATFDGQPLTGIKVTSVSFRENGRVQPVQLLCPDTSVYNSVMLVIDNSGSISNALNGIKTAAIRFVDSLKASDEAALIRFGSGVTLAQDFTTNKTLLRNAINGMTAGGGTPLYSAMLQAVTRLATRPGKKICITLTDGSDNASSATPSEIIALAKANAVTMYTIGFGASQLNEQVLREIASETGGKYYRVIGSGTLPTIFEEIALAITSFCCRGEYIASSCTDSLRRFEASITINGQTTHTDTTLISPSRPDTVTVRVVAPPEVTPNGNALVYFQIEPRLAMNVMTKFKVRFRYDAQLLSFQPLFAITLGTMTEGQSLSVRSLQPGDVEISGDYLALTYSTGNLFGVRLKGLAADSSRPVPIEILSSTIENGCPLIINTIDDTIDVCQCKSPIDFNLDTLRIVRSGGTILIPLTITSGLQPNEPIVFSIKVLIDSFHLTIEDVRDTYGRKTVFKELGQGEVQIFQYNSFVPKDTQNVLFFITLRARQSKTSVSVPLSALNIKVYQRCCEFSPASHQAAILVDGLCEPIAAKKRGTQLFQNTPNPFGEKSGFGSATLISYSLSEASPVLLEILDAFGRRVLLLRDTQEKAGMRQVEFDASALRGGMYFYRLTAGSDVKTKRMVKM